MSKKGWSETRLTPKEVSDGLITLKTLVSRCGGFRTTWMKFLEDPLSKDVLKLVEKNNRLFKFKLLKSENEVTEKYLEMKYNNRVIANKLNRSKKK
jgi:hypothetical protein